MTVIAGWDIYCRAGTKQFFVRASEMIGISPSALSRRHDAARRKLRDNANTSKLAAQIVEQYKSTELLRIAKSQA